MSLVELLKAKNDCLRKYYEITSSYSKIFDTEDFDDLEKFISHRESILKVVSLYDDKVNTIAEQTSTPLDAEVVEEIKFLEDEKENILRKIAKIDEIVVGKIESARIEVRAEIARSTNEKQTLSKFKSQPNKRPGEEFDAKL